MVISTEARLYKASIKKLAFTWPKIFFTGELCIFIQAYPPDKRKRDLDNTLKVSIDSLEGILFTNDSQIGEIHIIRMPVYTGKLVVRLKERYQENLCSLPVSSDNTSSSQP
jgi:crossover junction endodeoxyribonuclease RusA